jgi:hypothetical protein
MTITAYIFPARARVDRCRLLTDLFDRLAVGLGDRREPELAIRVLGVDSAALAASRLALAAR